MRSGLATLIRYWIPGRFDIKATAVKLSQFYSERADYHAMTADDTKLSHPQVQLLLSMVRPTDLCVDFGCGGGVILSAVAQRARCAIGADIGDEALSFARHRPGGHSVIKADIAHVPLADAIADVTYSLEVLEHVWNPEAVLLEMIRLTKPGGIIFFTTPNGYSLDLHLKLRPAVRAFNLLGAATVELQSRLSGRIFQNIPPDLDAMPVYADCDMITRIHPRRLPKFAKRNGCRVERLETFFFKKFESATTAERERLSRFEEHPFYHCYGDHILFVCRKVA